jgi:solute carrier family 19 (thiamine transporter), member 2/3
MLLQLKLPFKLSAQILALCWAVFIPPVKTSMYFNRDMSDGKITETYTHNQTSNAFHLIWNHFKTSYGNASVIMWSVFYAVALCFYVQITAYIQVLWISIDDSQEIIYNGAVDAILTLFGFAVSILAGKVHLNFLHKKNRVLIVLIIMSSLQGCFVVFAANSRSLLSCYIFYVLYGTSYAFCIVICASEIAKNLRDDAFGLVFGFNSLIALIIQTTVTLSVVSNGFLLPPSEQYQVYGYSYLALSGLYVCALAFEFVRK